MAAARLESEKGDMMKKASSALAMVIAAAMMAGCSTHSLRPLEPAARSFGPPLAVAAVPLLAYGITSALPPAKSPFMTPHPLQVLAASPADQARVVFMRPAGFNQVEKLLIVDGHGGFVGHSLAESYFTADVAAGSHLFVGIGKKAAPLDAMLEAGKTYYVLVQPRTRIKGRVRFELLRALPERDPVDEWLRESTRYEVDTRAGHVGSTGKKSG